MKWLVNIIKKFFVKKEVKLIEQTQNIAEKEEKIGKENKKRNNFVTEIKQSADLECNEGNGYKIIKNLRLKDMI